MSISGSVGVKGHNEMTNEFNFGHLMVPQEEAWGNEDMKVITEWDNRLNVCDLRLPQWKKRKQGTSLHVVVVQSLLW